MPSAPSTTESDGSALISSLIKMMSTSETFLTMTRSFGSTVRPVCPRVSNNFFLEIAKCEVLAPPAFGGVLGRWTE
jgi:hypothetical protein